MSEEAHHSFACFGGTASVHVRGTDASTGEREAERLRGFLLDAHRRLSRFLDGSELTRLNRDPRREVPASPLLRRVAASVEVAGRASRGLVDATLLGSIEAAGYKDSIEDGDRPSLVGAMCQSSIAPARAHPARRWREVRVDEAAGTIVRPPGLEIDSGGIAKGLLADLLAETLDDQRAYAVDCCGDIRIGGSAGQQRAVTVGNPLGGDPVHVLRLSSGAVATSGVGRRRWVGPSGELAHHILDPHSGKPAHTGIAQATALAPTGLIAETYAKSALLSGPDRAERWLPHGGVLVFEDGEVKLIEAAIPTAQSMAIA